MQKIDRLGWAAGLALTAYGLRIGIRTNDPEMLGRVLPLLPPGWKPAASAEVDDIYSLLAGAAGARPGLRRFHLLYCGSRLVVRTLDLEEALRVLEIDLQAYVAESARRWVFVHAGVVGWEGRAIVLPGRTGSGKSTLVEALVRAGATYFSDELAPFDARGRVHPFPVPLGIRQAGAGGQKRRSLEGLGEPGVRTLPVGLVLVTRYASAADWRPRLLTPGKAVLELLRHTVPARQRPAAALTTLSRAVRHARAWKGPRGEADVLAHLILEGESRSGSAAPAALEFAGIGGQDGFDATPRA